MKIGRGDWIRTSDPLHPKQVRYQTALRPDSGGWRPEGLRYRFPLRLPRDYFFARELAVLRLPVDFPAFASGAFRAFGAWYSSGSSCAATAVVACPLPRGRLSIASNERNSSRTLKIRLRASAGSDAIGGSAWSSSNGSASLPVAPRSSSIFRRAPASVRPSPKTRAA